MPAIFTPDSKIAVNQCYSSLGYEAAGEIVKNPDTVPSWWRHQRLAPAALGNPVRRPSAADLPHDSYGSGQ
jgi:hypothetical protein